MARSLLLIAADHPRHSGRSDYDAEPIRQALLRSIAAVSGAQMAVTAFYNRLKSSS